MKCYQELTLLPSYDVPLHFIWSKVYQQLHLAFVEQMDENEHINVGISFPEYMAEEKAFSLGTKARIFGPTEAGLKQLDLSRFLARLRDYVHLTGVRPVPAKVHGFSIYSRVHADGNPRQKARRYAKRHNVTYEEAIKLFPDRKCFYFYPYVQLKSMTNEQKFALFVKKTKMKSPVQGNFGSYGLGDAATVPEF